MSREVDPECDRSRCKTIILAGEEFLVAPLPLRQVLALAAAAPKLDIASAEGSGADKLIVLIEIIHLGLVKAYPNLTRDDLLDMPITIWELNAALPIVMYQGGAKETPAGEHLAASPSLSSTGASSSPTSA